MKQLLLDLLADWNADKSDKRKLQRVYFTLAIVIAVVAGLVSLASPSVGSNLVILAAYLASIFITNAVIWALVEAFVIKKINEYKKPLKKR